MGHGDPHSLHDVTWSLNMVLYELLKKPPPPENTHVLPHKGKIGIILFQFCGWGACREEAKHDPRRGI